MAATAETISPLGKHVGEFQKSIFHFVKDDLYNERQLVNVKSAKFQIVEKVGVLKAKTKEDLKTVRRYGKELRLAFQINANQKHQKFKETGTSRMNTSNWKKSCGKFPT